MLTILEAAKLFDNPLQSRIVEVFAVNNPVLERLPFVDIQGNAYRYNRESSLSGIAFRGINEAYTESTGIINLQVETLTICGYDVALVRMAGNGNSLRAAHDALKAKALTLTWLKTFFDGNSAGEPREFDGVNRRLTGSQVIDAGTAGGATLTLPKLDELIDAVEGTPDVLLMNKVTPARSTRWCGPPGRRSKPSVTRLAGRSRPMPASDRHCRGRCGGSPIRGFDEDDGQGNDDTTSVYAVPFGLDATSKRRPSTCATWASCRPSRRRGPAPNGTPVSSSSTRRPRRGCAG